MCNHDHDAAARAYFHNRLGQRLVALGVEVGIRLVEHHEERIAIERARERDALALAGREHRTALPDLRVIAFRKPDDHIVHVRGLGGRDHRIGGGIRLVARDVLRHRPGEQLHVLRQVADMLSELARRPLVHGGAVDANLAAHRHPYADDEPRER